jgi:hypothetical protein
MPPLLGNHKLNTLVVARQTLVKQFHGYAGLPNGSTWLHGNQQQDGRCFYWGSQVLHREDKTQQESVQFSSSSGKRSVPSARSNRSVQYPQRVGKDKLVPVSSGYESVSQSVPGSGRGQLRQNVHKERVHKKDSRSCLCRAVLSDCDSTNPNPRPYSSRSRANSARGAASPHCCAAVQPWPLPITRLLVTCPAAMSNCCCGP